VKIKLKKPTEIILFKTPSSEKISIEELKDKTILILVTKVEKSILQSNIDSPKLLREEDSIDVKLINNSQKSKEKFIKNAQNKSLKTNCEGFSKLLIM